jgi:hypothetical protein
VASSAQVATRRPALYRTLTTWRAIIVASIRELGKQDEELPRKPIVIVAEVQDGRKRLRTEKRYWLGEDTVMDLIIVGYVLQALACTKVDDAVTRDCITLKPRSTPTNLYVCQRSMAVTVERVPSISNAALGLGDNSYHFTFSCEPVHAQRHSV